MTMPDAVQRDRGQPGKIRIGTIASVNPVVLDLQGTLITADRVGSLNSYTPIAGDTVAVAGQSAVGSSASSWLILGSVGTAGSTDLVAISLFSTGQSIPNATIEEIEFFGENYNTGEFVWSSLTDITLPYDGIYLFTFNVVFNPEGGGAGVRYCEILVGGGQQARHRHPGIAGDFGDVGVTHEANHLAGAIVNFRVYQTSGAPLSVSQSTATIRYIGPV